MDGWKRDHHYGGDTYTEERFYRGSRVGIIKLHSQKAGFLLEFNVNIMIYGL